MGVDWFVSWQPLLRGRGSFASSEVGDFIIHLECKAAMQANLSDVQFLSIMSVFLWCHFFHNNLHFSLVKFPPCLVEQNSLSNVPLK